MQLFSFLEPLTGLPLSAFWTLGTVVILVAKFSYDGQTFFVLVISSFLLMVYFFTLEVQDKNQSLHLCSFYQQLDSFNGIFSFSIALRIFG